MVIASRDRRAGKFWGRFFQFRVFRSWLALNSNRLAISFSLVGVDLRLGHFDPTHLPNLLFAHLFKVGLLIDSTFDKHPMGPSVPFKIFLLIQNQSIIVMSQ